MDLRQKQSVNAELSCSGTKTKFGVKFGVAVFKWEEIPMSRRLYDGHED